MAAEAKCGLNTHYKGVEMGEIMQAAGFAYVIDQH